MEQEDNTMFRMSLDFARRDKNDVKVKITACGNTREEFEDNLAFLKEKARHEGGY